MDILTDPYARVAHSKVVALWVEATALCGDVDFGLHAAEASQTFAFDVLDQATQHSSTVGEAIGHMRRFIRLLHDAATIKQEDEGDLCRLTWHFDCEPPLPRAMLDFILTRWVLRLVSCNPQPSALREVRFPYPRPPSISEHERLLRLPLRFGAAHGSLVLERRLFELPVPNHNPVLGQAMQRHIEDLLPSAPEQPELLTQARRCIAEQLPEGAPELKRVARVLGTSNRSLQRRLSELGTSFQEVVDATRRDVAMQRLRDPKLSLTDVAFLTGFADVSAFHRAFRRWTGKTPREHRTV